MNFYEIQAIRFLRAYKKKTIPLIEIERILPGNVEYIDFDNIINKFPDVNVLLPVKSHGTPMLLPY